MLYMFIWLLKQKTALLVYRRSNLLGMLGEHEKFVDHSLLTCDLQLTFLVFFQNPAWVVTPVLQKKFNFYGFTGVLDDRFLTNHGARSVSVILQTAPCTDVNSMRHYILTIKR